MVGSPQFAYYYYYYSYSYSNSYCLLLLLLLLLVAAATASSCCDNSYSYHYHYHYHHSLSRLFRGGGGGGGLNIQSWHYRIWPSSSVNRAHRAYHIFTLNARLCASLPHACDSSRTAHCSTSVGTFGHKKHFERTTCAHASPAHIIC